jgi:hypothetical protein
VARKSPDQDFLDGSRAYRYLGSQSADVSRRGARRRRLARFPAVGDRIHPHNFLAKPKLLLGHVRSERQTADDYAGRELLELVQNAADAATEAGGRGRVRIEVGPAGLVVANTGQPFRTGGIESLMTPNASDKPGRKVALIGAKGLGFRSLLNWSQEPVISSGDLEVGFSRAHAEAAVEELARQSAAIAAIRDAEDEPPVPVLAFPAFGEALHALSPRDARSLLTRARDLRAGGTTPWWRPRSTATARSSTRSGRPVSSSRPSCYSSTRLKTSRSRSRTGHSSGGGGLRSATIPTP